MYNKYLVEPVYHVPHLWYTQQYMYVLYYLDLLPCTFV